MKRLVDLVASITSCLDDFPDPADLRLSDTEAHRCRLAELQGLVTASRPTLGAVGELCGVAAMHPDPWVRRTVLGTLSQFVEVNEDEVSAAVTWLTHDPEDFVAFEAIRLAGDLRLQSALRDLLLLVGSASDRLRTQAGKPVGIGHAMVLDAIVRIVGTDDTEVLGEIDSGLFDGTHEFPTSFAEPPAPAPSVAHPQHDDSGMVFVPEGEVRFAIPRGLAASSRVFDWSDVEEPWSTDGAGFWIDAHQVTVAEYDEFVASDVARSHELCHPSEPPDKLHVRNTLLDLRFQTRHPATGVDWFDAYAFAAWSGKRLPTESEWQRAAQGDDDRAFPGGDAFDPSKVRCHSPALGCGHSTIAAWRSRLLELNEDRGVPLTVPVDHAGNVSPFGVCGMVGNAWEWTASNFFSRNALEPEVGTRDALAVVYDWRSYPVIRGGAWSSLPELTSVAFRGRDLLTDRHFENGFRCVCDCPQQPGR